MPNKALATVMIRKGYKLVHVTHLPEDETRLPPAIAEALRRLLDEHIRCAPCCFLCFPLSHVGQPLCLVVVCVV